MSDMTEMRTEVDPDLLGKTVQSLFLLKQGEIMSAIVHLGEKLGLFAALADHGPCMSAQLAAATGLHERWVREWLHAIAAAGLADHHEGRFALTPEAAAVLCDRDHPASVMGVFGPPITHREIDRTIEAFSSGIGLTWSEHGEHACHFQASMGAAGQRAFLVPVMLGSIEGLSERLASGAKVVDVGCGAGVAATAIAEAFPASHVIGIDPSPHAIETAAANARRLVGHDGPGHDDPAHDSPGHDSPANLEFRSGSFDDLSEVDSVDLLLTLDVLHDLPRPADAAAAAAACLAPDGIWLVADIKTRGGLEDNRRIPVLPLMYGMSVLYCMSSAMSEPGGAGLGTLGLTVATFESLAQEAGFASVEVCEFEVDPLNRYFVARL